MAAIPPVISESNEDGIRTVYVGQTTDLRWGAFSCREAADDRARFSGTLTLHAAGSGMEEHFGLDTKDGHIVLVRNRTGFYVETFVHVDGACVGSYVDLGTGPYFNMSLRSASTAHVDILLRHIQFTTASEPIALCLPGLRTITVELREQGSGRKMAAQTMIDVVARPTK